MTQQTKTQPVIRYSPRPLSAYAKTSGGITIGPHDSPMLRQGVAWNLAYLSHDYDSVLHHPDPEFTVLVRRSCQTQLDGSGVDVASIRDPQGSVGHLLTYPAPRFVYLIKQHPVLPSIPLYLKYGQKWLDTITERSHRCQADETPPDNVVDFSQALALLAKF